MFLQCANETHRLGRAETLSSEKKKKDQHMERSEIALGVE